MTDSMCVYLGLRGKLNTANTGVNPAELTASLISYDLSSAVHP